jgi:hypothetical protein
MDELVFREEVYAVVGAAIEVHRDWGRGFWKRFIRRRWSGSSCFARLPSRHNANW